MNQHLLKYETTTQPFDLEALERALSAVGLHGLTVSVAAGIGDERGRTMCYRGREYVVGGAPKMAIELVVAEEAIGDVVSVIRNAARMGWIGAGNIFQLPIEAVIEVASGGTRIRAA
jgi:nitrogen regulatory protein P-II 1